MGTLSAVTLSLGSYFLLWYYFALPPGWAALLLLPIFLLGKGKKFPALCLGLALGILWIGLYENFYEQPLQSYSEGPRWAEISLSDYSRQRDYGTEAEGRIFLEGRSYRVRCYLPEKQCFSPGDVLSGRFRFTDAGGKRNLELLARPVGDWAHRAGTPRGLEKIAVFRGEIVEILEAVFPEDCRAFAKALLLGDSSDFDYETDTALKLSGIRHVVAVSGLHISVLMGLMSVLCLQKPGLKAALGFPFLLLCGALAGFTPSVSRTCLMMGLVLLGDLLNRGYDGKTALAFAVLVLLLRNPKIIGDIGFQLSVASVLGIFFFQPGISGYLNGKFPGCRKLNASVAVTLGASVFTTGLGAWHFGTVSLLAVLTNLLVLWAVTLVFTGELWVVFLGFFWPKGAALLAGVLSWGIRYILSVARLLGCFPLAAVYTKSVYIVLWLLFLYLLLGVFCIQRRKKPGILLACGLSGLCLALLLSWNPGDNFTMLDVGQGQCLLLQSGGKQILIDCGGDSPAVSADSAAQTLLSRGITRLDALVLTHWDKDHAGGIGNLLGRISCDCLILPPFGENQQFPGKKLYAKETLQLQLPAGTLTVFPPEGAGGENENSLCVLLDTEKYVILVTGDRGSVGEELLLKQQLPKVDILVAGHHGSKNATGDRLLQAISPEIVCISVGAGNRYGHPAEETLLRIAKQGAKLYRTDLQGDIVLRR